MRTTILLAALAAVLAAPAARADRDDDDDRRHGHKHKNKHKEEYWDGNCKVERKWKHGEYEEKRKCKGPDRVQKVYVQPAQPTVVYVPWMVRERDEYVYKQQYRPAQVAGTYRCNSPVVGQVLGGIVGGALGNQIGKGDGRTLATIGGAVAGVLVGGELGKRLDAQNQGCVGEVLEVAPSGRRVAWEQGPTNYVVVPGEVQYVQGSYCRPYRMEVKTERGWQRTSGTACRRPDGVWIRH